MVETEEKAESMVKAYVEESVVDANLDSAVLLDALLRKSRIEKMAAEEEVLAETHSYIPPTTPTPTTTTNPPSLP